MKNILILLMLLGFSNLFGIYSGPGTQEINGVFPRPQEPLTKSGMVISGYDDSSLPPVTQELYT